MIDGVEVKKLTQYSDERGWLAEIFRFDNTDFRPVMGYVSETKPGIARGPHEHKFQTDYFVFLKGDFVLYLWENRPGRENYRQLEKFEVGESNPSVAVVPPGVVHAYKCVSDQNGLVINLPDKLFMGENRQEEVDEIRWENDPESPFNVE